ncbi:MAG: peptidoglycan-binding domain-containing protein [Candidatus Humimicrobiaceae bacterium]
MPTGNCYTNTLQPLNPKHQAVIKEVYKAGIERLYGNLADVRPKRDNETWFNYMGDVIEYLPDGMRLWTNDEGQDHVFNGSLGEGSFKNLLLMCKITDRIPLVVWGHNEEQSSWLSRNPVNHLDFLENFSKYFAIYLREKMGFTQAHLEVWNESQKCMPNTDDYAKVVEAMGRGFKQYANFKVHMGSNDINVDVDFGYAQSLVNRPELKGKVDYYSSHALWPRQHKQGYMAKLNEILAGTGLKLSITEFSPNGDWGQYGVNGDYGAFNELIENGVTIWCILFAFRRDFFGDVFDDIKIFTREARTIDGKYYASGDWLPNGFNSKKYITLIDFINKFYGMQIPMEAEMFQLEKYYYRLKVTFNRDINRAGIKFIQTVVGATPDGKWGDATDEAVEKYQVDHGLAADKIVGPDTFRDMMKNYPKAYIDLEYFTLIGEW